jgi:hypothetical protein
VVASVGEPLERTVVLASPDHPFRVTGFAAPAGVGSSLKILSEIGSRHEVLLSVAATTGPGAHSIEFTTDDPSQPSVRLTLLLLAREANDATN